MHPLRFICCLLLAIAVFLPLAAEQCPAGVVVGAADDSGRIIRKNVGIDSSSVGKRQEKEDEDVADEAANQPESTPWGPEPVQEADQDESLFPELGAIVRATPRIRVRAMYDSNVDNKGFDDVQTVIKPGLTVRVKNDRLDLKLKGDYLYRDFMHHDELDRSDWFTHADLGYKLSENTSVGLMWDQAHDHMVDWAAESFASDVQATIRDTYTIKPSFNWQVSELDGVNLSYDQTRSNFDNERYTDYTSHTGTASWGRPISETMRFFLNAQGIYTEYTTELTKDDWQWTALGMAGLDWQLTEGVKLIASAGGGATYSEYTEIDPTLSKVTKDYSDMIYVLDVKLEWRRPEWEVVPSVTRRVTPSYYGENFTVDQFKLRMRYELAEHLDLNLTGTYTMSETAGYRMKRKWQGYFLQSVLNWWLTEDFKLEFGANFNHSKNDISKMINERFRGWVGVEYRFPYQFNP